MNKLTLIILISFIGINRVSASTLEAIYGAYRSGFYPKVLTLLDTHRQKLKPAFYHYWKGRTYNRTQQFSSAVLSFKEALKQPNYELPDDVYYELGQALYAANELKMAAKVFNKSNEKNYKKNSSLYYIGLIARELKSYGSAKKFLAALAKGHPSISQELQQSAAYQLSEVHLESFQGSEKEKKMWVVKTLIPQMENAIEIASSTPAVNEIRARIQELKSQYDTSNGTRMENGRLIAGEAFKGGVTFSASYDNNVTTEGEATPIRATNKDSYIGKTEVYSSYRHIWNRTMAIYPEVKASYLHHFERTNANVFENDAHELSLKIKNSWDYLFNEKISTFWADVEYNRNYQDFDQDKKREFYSSHIKVYFNKDIQVFSIGKTTLGLHIKELEVYDNANDSRTSTFALTQVGTFKWGGLNHTFVGMMNIDNIVSQTPANSTVSRLFSLTYVPPLQSEKWKGRLTFNLTYNDPRDARHTRGIEKTYNPEGEITYVFSKDFKTNLSHSYTHKNSRDKINYAHTKQVTKLSLDLTF